MWRAGLRGWYFPQAAARHHGGASSETTDGKQPSFVFQQLTRNHLAVLAKHYPGSLMLRLSLRIGFAQMLWAAMALRQRRAGPYLRGVYSFIRAFPSIVRKRCPWTTSDCREFLAMLRRSDADIYEDIHCRAAAHRGGYWRAYFALFPAPVISQRKNQGAGPQAAVPEQEAGTGCRLG
jgi:hypothetical protein